MKAMKPFYFTHPQYGKLRVVVIGGKIYYCLMDVKNIFKKSVQKLYETIADSEGELKNLNIVMMKNMKIKYNLFFENQEMGKEEAEAENVNADINFCDEQLEATRILPMSMPPCARRWRASPNTSARASCARSTRTSS